ncbi:hypothetical protein Tco_0934408, partial [Tanacetum coccineum]
MSQPANDDFSQHLSDDEASYQEDASDNRTANNKPKQQQQLTSTTTTISNIKLPILKRMNMIYGPCEMEHYLEYIDKDKIMQFEKERKERPSYLCHSQGTSDKNSCGMYECKRKLGSQKVIGLVLEAHGAEVSTEDANHKFLRSFPPAWSNLAMTMRTKPDVDTLSQLMYLYKTLLVVCYARTYKYRVRQKHLQSKKYILFMHTAAMTARNQEVKSVVGPRRAVVPDGRKEGGGGGGGTPSKWEGGWIAMIAIRMKKFYKKTRRRVRIDGNKPVDQEMDKRAESLRLRLRVASVVSMRFDSSMTSNSKVGLGYEIQSNNEVLSYEEEMNRTVFKCTEEDFLNKPLYSRFSKTNNFKGVPHPLYGDYTPKPQEEIDDSLYVYGKKGPQKPEISDSDDNSTEHSTCQSNDSEGSVGNPSEHSSKSESESISVPNEMSTSKSVITNEKVVSESKEVEPSCATHVKTTRQQMKNQGTPEKTVREAELKKQRVFNTGKGVAKPVWNNANRVNRANHFVPRPVQLNAVRSNVNTGRANVNTVKANINSVRQNVNSVRTNINTVRSKQPVPTNNTNSFSPVRPQ